MKGLRVELDLPSPSLSSKGGTSQISPRQTQVSCISCKVPIRPRPIGIYIITRSPERSLANREATIETLPNKDRGKRYVSQHVFGELTSVCPTTRLPDFYTVKLTYEPDELLPELKSLKLYFLAFRNVEILHEEIANRILDDFVRTIRPLWAQIIIKVNNRGGILTTVARKWSRTEGDVLVKPEILDETFDSN
jgi:7-cyano-7-deazaguanine reductase